MRKKLFCEDLKLKKNITITYMLKDSPPMTLIIPKFASTATLCQ